MYNCSMSAKVRFQVYLESTQLAAMRRLQAQIGVPVAVQLRRGIDLYLATHRVSKTAQKRTRTR